MLKMEALSNEIRAFCHGLEETERDKSHKRSIVLKIQSIIDKKTSDAQIVVVGSCGNGFGTRESDLDMTVLLRNRGFSSARSWSGSYSSYTSPSSILSHLESSLLQDRGAYKEVKHIRTAKVPIVSFVDHSCGRTSCDVSVDKTNNVHNAILLKAYSRLDDRVKPLVIALKTWAKAAGILDARNLRLSSFTFTLIVIHYLQNGCSPKVLPSLQQQKPRLFSTSNTQELLIYLDRDFPRSVLSFSSSNRQTLGDLFNGFFNYYCDFSWSQGISVREGRCVSRPARIGSNNTCLYVEDPFAGDNTARSVFRQYVWEDILGKFRKTKRLLDQRKSFNQVVAAMP